MYCDDNFTVSMFLVFVFNLIIGISDKSLVIYDSFDDIWFQIQKHSDFIGWTDYVFLETSESHVNHSSIICPNPPPWTGCDTS